MDTVDFDVLTLAETQQCALDAVLATARPGKFVVLLGGSGKGKSRPPHFSMPLGPSGSAGRVEGGVLFVKAAGGLADVG